MGVILRGTGQYENPGFRVGHSIVTPNFSDYQKKQKNNYTLFISVTFRQIFFFGFYMHSQVTVAVTLRLVFGRK